MLTMRAFAKINWTLDIRGVRDDGYHQMDMLMQRIALHDTLLLEPADRLTLEGVSTGMPAFANVSGDMNAFSAGYTDTLNSHSVTYDERNLVWQAAALLRSRYNVCAGARMRLWKRIPSGAGMGGGSADAAAALIGLNRLWNLHISDAALNELGLSLGADVPFMLRVGMPYTHPILRHSPIQYPHGKRFKEAGTHHAMLARVSGIGEVITPLYPAPSLWLVLTQPCDGLSTKEVFKAFDAFPQNKLCRPNTNDAQDALLRCDIKALGAAMGNVLEAVSAESRPVLKSVRQQLESAGAARAMMTGSGSVVYGVFATRAKAYSAVTFLTERHVPCLLTNTLS